MSLPGFMKHPAEDGGTTPRFVHDRFFDEQARADHERGRRPAFGRIGALLLQPDAQEAR